METKFKIANYSKENDKFIKIGYDEYLVTYLKGVKTHQLRIVVNGYLTKEVINLISFKEGYKNKILKGIKEYKENLNNLNNLVNKKITIEYIKQIYSKSIVKNVETYLMNVNKEDSRDKLTEIGFFKNII